MREEEFWQQNDQYQEFYMFWEEYHNGGGHDENPFCPDGTEEELNSDQLDTTELAGFQAACQAINEESEEPVDCGAIKLVLHFQEKQCSSTGDIDFDCQTEFFDGQSNEADWGHCEDSHELKMLWEYTKDDQRWQDMQWAWDYIDQFYCMVEFHEGCGVFPTLFSEDETDGCEIHSSYNKCGEEENYYDFQCEVHKEGQDPEDCSQDFFDPEFWAVMRAEEFW